jgi:NAD(P) transhydrogenase subunit beta
MVIGLVEFMKNTQVDDTQKASASIVATIMAAITIGAITFTGSLVAWAKLDGSMKDIRLPKYNLMNNAVLLGLIAFSAYLVYSGSDTMVLVYILLLASLIYGFLFVIPIGGADMPVVISLLNSLTGISAAITGILYDNMVMLVGGILVGSAGLILTFAMCKAMNRTLPNVLFSGFGTTLVTDGDAGDSSNKTVKTIDPEECAMMLGYARSVVIVPGYGMAVAQAQHAVRELSDMLERKGVEVKFAIHPVAGRMPGHMNVLLAEANVPYSQLYDMDDINTQFENTDVVLIIGANDVVNPAAKTNQASPIYGMPILEVDKAKNAIVIKRGMSAGFAGVENDLFYQQKTMM